VLKAVTLHNIGCETEGGKFDPIVPKNTPVPTKKSDVYTTAKDNQSSVEVHILEDTGEMFADNRSLGRFHFDGIPPAPKALPQIELVYEIDTGGKLYIQAKDLGTGKKQSAIMEERVSIKKPEDEVALNGINDVHSLLQQAKKHGINTKSEEEKLNDAKRKLDRKEFSKVIILAIECKNSLNWKIDKYKKAGEKCAKQSLDYAYSKIKEAEKLGINVSSAHDLHKRAIREFDKREYEKAIKSAENGKKFTEDEISRYSYAKEQIRKSKDIVENVKRIVSIPKAESSIKNAEAALEIGNYNSAFKLAKGGEGEALKFKQDYERYKETSDFISSIESEIEKLKSSDIKIRNTEELIEQAKAELNNNNFERAKELTKEATRIVSETKSRYNLAFKSVSEAKRILNETKNRGVVISTNLLARSKQAFDNGGYEEAIKISEELKNLASDREIQYKEAQEQIRLVESTIERAKEFGCDVLDVEDRLKRVERLFEEGAYKEVINGSKRIGERTKKIREESKPKITLNLSQTSFKPNKWQKIDLTIKNRGTATAKAIRVGYPEGRVEIDGLRATEELKPNEEKSLEISFIAIQEGEVPLTAKITYRDLENKEYTEEQSFSVRVGEEPLKETEKMKRGTRLEYKYQVALSFAGEDRTQAEKLAKLLKERHISFFYDSYEQAYLWGKDLYQHFQSVYRDKSQYCVVFLSKAYAQKFWTQHELKQAQARAFLENKEYILPVRIDETEIPGINETTGYIDLNSTTVEEIADLLVKKLSS
jgi:hypothetical protein